MKTLKFLAAGAIAAALVGCGSAPTTPQQTIFQVESDYNAAAQIVLVYKGLPPCAPGSPPLCSKADVVAKLKDADNVAYNALVAAENVARAPGAGANAQTAILAAQQATAALTAIASSVGVKP